MTEYTEEQNACVEYYYNLKKLQESMEGYSEALKRSSNAKIKMDIALNEGNNPTAKHWETIYQKFSTLANEYLSKSTDSYKKIKNG